MISVARFFDSYSRVARVYPALLAIGPIVVSVAALFPSLSSDIPHGVAAVTAASCLLYLLASIARARGQQVEDKLLKVWGGWPTTTILRHRDGTIDRVTKARYHSALSTMCGGLVFPTVDDEQADPIAADEIYRSATKRLIELRRGPEFKLLHDENASYGFRRNLLGLKPIAISIAVLATILAAGVWWLAIGPTITWPIAARSILKYPHLPILAVFDLSYLTVFSVLVRPRFVAHAARDYAESLFKTLEGV